MGERAGNVPLEQLLVVLNEEKPALTVDIQALAACVRFVSATLDHALSPNYPLFGRDSFSTASGVHASALEKAEALNANGLAGLVYSPVDPRRIGRDYDFQVGPMSGKSNVRRKLARLGIDQREDTVGAVLNYAKTARSILSDSVILMICNQVSQRRPTDQGLDP